MLASHRNQTYGHIPSYYAGWLWHQASRHSKQTDIMTFSNKKHRNMFSLSKVLHIICMIVSPALGVAPFPKLTVCLSSADGRNTNLLGVAPFPVTSAARKHRGQTDKLISVG